MGRGRSLGAAVSEVRNASRVLRCCRACSAWSRRGLGETRTIWVVPSSSGKAAACLPAECTCDGRAELAQLCKALSGVSDPEVTLGVISWS